MSRLAAACLLLLTVAQAAAARNPRGATVVTPQAACLIAIAATEQRLGLPDKLLGAIALVESGRPDPVDGRTLPWPWTINVAGMGQVFPTKDAAMEAVRALQAAGLRSIDVGCLQVNLMFHPHAFASLDQAFDPDANAAYGGRFLEALHAELGNWPRAAAAYHSQTPALGQAYESRVLAVWPLAGRYPDPSFSARAVAPRVAGPDYGTLTPEFAARVRQMEADRASLAARFGPVIPAAPPPRARRRLPPLYAQSATEAAMPN